jgi:hypothetical protein
LAERFAAIEHHDANERLGRAVGAFFVERSAMDRLAAALVQLGYAVTPKSIYRDGYTGNHVRLEHAEIVYRLEPDDETVVIPWYQADASSSGNLRNSFAPFEWFLAFLARPEFRLERVRGLIRAPRGPGISPRLSTARIAEFYKRLLGGRTESWDGGEEWLVLDFKDYRARAELRRDATPLKSAGTR